MLLRATVIGLLLYASFSLFAATSQPSTTSNNDSCDISVTPAATLLLPYFEVDTAAPVGTGTTTLFTIINTSRYPQIAHVTVWTDWAFPVLGFNVFLTGYDVQGINLYDVVVRGIIAPGIAPSGTSITTVPGSPQPAGTTVGSTPLSNTANPNFVRSGEFDVATTCRALPGFLSSDLATAVKNALTTGIGFNAGGVNCGTSQIGFNHGPRAVGYVTVDVVSYCTTQLPTDSNGRYFVGPTAPILYDNVLSGDYQQLGPTPAGSGAAPTFDAGASPLVHIHAVPEGGLSGAGGGVPVATNLPFTFYDRYTAGAPGSTRTSDRRQPLPSAWTARYIQGGASTFATDLKIWREGLTAGPADCLTARRNAAIGRTNIIRFDEHENSYGFFISFCTLGCTLPNTLGGATSRSASHSSNFPTLTGTDVGGWFYLNLSSSALDDQGRCQPVLSAQRAGFGTCGNTVLGVGGSRTTSQNWVIASMFGAVGANRLSVDFDGLALGNGCTPPADLLDNIGPAALRNGLVCPQNTSPSNCAPGTVPPPVNP